MQARNVASLASSFPMPTVENNSTYSVSSQRIQMTDLASGSYRVLCDISKYSSNVLFPTGNGLLLFVAGFGRLSLK